MSVQTWFTLAQKAHCIVLVLTVAHATDSLVISLSVMTFKTCSVVVSPRLLGLLMQTRQNSDCYGQQDNLSDEDGYDSLHKTAYLTIILIFVSLQSKREVPYRGFLKKGCRI